MPDSEMMKLETLRKLDPRTDFFKLISWLLTVLNLNVFFEQLRIDEQFFFNFGVSNKTFLGFRSFLILFVKF